jgi:hypothetical protein
MKSLPFSREQFFEAFSRYNEGVMPLQLGLLLLGLTAFAAMMLRQRESDRVISAILAALWAWMGVVYHFTYFAPVNPAAPLFGIMFLAGAGVFAWAGVVRGRLAFDGEDRARRITGHVLIVYSLVVYPLLSVLLGREYPEMPTFGLPCPTTIFTIGMLAFVSTPFPRAVLVVPIVWAVIGGEAAFLLGMYEDIGLIAAGLAGAWLAFDLPRQEKPA